MIRMLALITEHQLFIRLRTMYPWYRYFNYIGDNNVFYQRRNDIAADNNHNES